MLLARALHRRLKVLFLDEGTAHLDLERERRTNAVLHKLDITRISIAHRPEIADGTDLIELASRARGT